MIIQSKLNHIKESQHAVLHPIYKENNACSNLSILADYNFSEDADKTLGVVTKIPTLGKLPYRNLYFVGLGPKEDITKATLLEAFAKASKEIKEDTLIVDLKRCVIDTLTFQDVAAAFTEANILSTYEFTKIGTEKKENKTQYELISKEDIRETIEKTTILANAINNARTLANTPPNFLVPTDISQYAKELFKKENVTIEILGNKQLSKIGAGGILGVNQGSVLEAQMIVLKYNGAKDQEYTALVGKGVTFDTGGYDLKKSMGNMKTDMHGAATVLSAFEVIVKQKLKANVYCIVPTTENMISATAYKADDVLTMLSGKTVEITNTDAEGRLILADALTYAGNLGASRIIDVATLTGACVAALGKEHTGVFTDSEAFYETFNNTSKDAGELTWRLPLHDAFNKVLKTSIVADLVNSAAPNGGGASVAASFLSEFVKDGIEWIHLDIAGSSSTNSSSPLIPKGATGVMVKTLSKLFE